MKKYDVLITYEIRNREIENICLIKHELERRGYSVGIRMQYRPFFYSEEPVDAKVIIVPGYYRERARFYSASHTLVTKKIVNMVWEQVFGAAKEDDSNVLFSIKPWGYGAAHIAWGPHMAGRMINEWGVPADHVFLTGHVGLDYLREPLRKYYLDRDTVFKKYNIPTDKRTHLFISSLVYSDANLRVLKNSTVDGDTKKPFEMADITDHTRKALISWFEQVLDENDDSIIIYRPHPEEKENKLLLDLVKRQPRFFVISEESVKQWILVSDNIYTWITTAVAEVFAAGKGCSILRPVDVPYDLDLKMYHSAKHICTYEQFREEFRNTDQQIAIDEKVLSHYYQINKEKFSYELICDVIEKVINDDNFQLSEPLKNPLIGGLWNKERFKNSIKRYVVNSPLMNRIHGSNLFRGSKFRELLDDVFYVKAKLEKNYVSEKEIADIMNRIENALESKEK